jgi:hypothetical protein
MVQFAMQELIERGGISRLTTDDARTVARIAELHIATSLQPRLDVVDEKVHRRSIR